MLTNPLRPLCQNLISVLRSVPNDLPSFVAPFIRLFDEKVGPRTCEDHLGLFPFCRSIKRGLTPKDLRGVLPIALLVTVHVAVGTTGRDLEATVPGIPGC